jgi:steroid delta-isomerase
MDVEVAARAHCDRFNTAVRTGDWAPFVATFADGGHMEFGDVPIGPFHGREAIAAAYAENPPDDTLTVESVEPVDAATARIRFTWDHGGPGTMWLHWEDGGIASLQITSS